MATQTTTGADKAGRNGQKGRSETAGQSGQELVEAALEALTDASPFSMINPTHTAAAARRLSRAALSHSPKVAKNTIGLANELARIGLGRSEVSFASDKRFADETWTTSPLYKRMAQSYLAWNSSVHHLIDELDLDAKATLRSHFVASLLTETVAPTNTLAGNPAAMKEAVRTRGASLRAGARHWWHDVRTNGAMPSMVDTRPFSIGPNDDEGPDARTALAATPGSVVFRNDVLELIRYQPTTAKVHERAVLIVPPQINKYYVLDLAPGRSLAEAAVAEGQQVFMVSWRNPTEQQRDWDLDTYCGALLEAIDATLDLTGQPDLNMVGVCAGGITTASLLGHLAALGDRRINAVTFLVTVLDWDVPSTMGTFTSAPAVAAAMRQSRSKGILPGKDLNRLFAWMRPNDLVWNYVVNNYLMGKNPPAFDILTWNNDATNLPAGLHCDFLSIAANNGLAKPGEVEVRGEKVDLAAITCDAYVVGGLTDHITPWEGCYSTVNLLGGATEFVLVGSGHIQTLVCPRDNPKAKYFTNSNRAETAEQWKAEATQRQGSWWGHWLEWMAPRAGQLINPPKRLGNRNHPAREAAPGQYVLA